MEQEVDKDQRILDLEEMVKRAEAQLAEKDKRIAELEKSELQLIDERDRREEQINKIADLLGDHREWTSHNDRGDNCLESIEQLQTANAALEQKLQPKDMPEPYYRCRGAHSVSELETLVENYKEYAYQKQLKNQALEQKVKSLEEEIKQDYCDNAKREREFVTKLAVSEAKLKKAVEQRNKECRDAIYNDKDNAWRIENYNNQLAAITAESIAKTEGEK